MNKEDFYFSISKLPLNSVKRACFIVREYIRCNKTNIECAVTKDEFKESLDIILAHSYQTSDKRTSIEQWHCNQECELYDDLAFCPGEFQIKENEKKLCRYFIKKDL